MQVAHVVATACVTPPGRTAREGSVEVAVAEAQECPPPPL